MSHCRIALRHPTWMLCRGIGYREQKESVKKSIEKPNRITRRRKAIEVRKEIKEIRIRFSLRSSASARECLIFSHFQTDTCAATPLAYRNLHHLATLAAARSNFISRFFKSASMATESPGKTSPSRSFSASGSWISRWMARFNGLAPYCES